MPVPGHPPPMTVAHWWQPVHSHVAWLQQRSLAEGAATQQAESATAQVGAGDGDGALTAGEGSDQVGGGASHVAAGTGGVLSTALASGYAGAGGGSACAGAALAAAASGTGAPNASAEVPAEVQKALEEVCLFTCLLLAWRHPR